MHAAIVNVEIICKMQGTRLNMLQSFQFLALALATTCTGGNTFTRYNMTNLFISLLTPYLLYPLKAISMTCSIFMMMSLALERYIAVAKPLSRVPSSHPGKFILKYLIPVLFASFLLNLPKFFLFHVSFINSSEIILSITQLRTNHYYITYYSWIR